MIKNFIALLFLAPFCLSATPLFDRVTRIGSFQDIWPPSSSSSVPTRSGKNLEVLLFSPESSEPPWPTVILISPYKLQRTFVEQLIPLRKKGYMIAYVKINPSLMNFLSSDVVFQDVEDVCSWMKENILCNGQIGMWGPSASAIIETILGGRGIPGLKSIYAISASPQLAKDSLFLGNVHREDLRNSRLSYIFNYLLGSLSLDASSIIFECIKPKKWITDKQPTTLYCTGWYDFFCQGTIDLFIEHGKQSSSNSVIVIGPWSHSPVIDPLTTLRDENNPPVDVSAQNWFDLTLKNQLSESEISSLYYVIHPEFGEWRRLEKWPIPFKECVFSFSTPNIVVKHDPCNPFPLVGGWNFDKSQPSGPILQNKILDHPSSNKSLIELYPTDKIVITGRPMICISCIADKQTICMARICHISKDGKWIPVSHMAKEIEKGEHEYMLDCSPTSFMLNPGDRVGVIFSSSCENVLVSPSTPTELNLCLEKSRIIFPIERSSEDPQQPCLAP
ncbi:CocE/NonD family hydrolase [Candidatus Similichlamydia epinepheli]|uniref:CocE/NonD family hydrolase n=1 Tax=Candidatus Similichlamydia epinepheli TaxID=1903953 RepID=UPI000D380B12|nr:CocE/NonD family hydrolase [Candidatus Similichlamydia epinepheli]